MVASRHPAAAAMVARLDAHRSRGGRVLLATSGGPDSMALLALSLALHDRRTPSMFEPIIAHVDHGLRPESDAEATLVRKIASRLALPFEHRRLSWPDDQGRVSSETARMARWAALDELAAGVGADTILTAHHADDQAETILMRLARGTGLSGLAGIPERRVTSGGRVVLRPLLTCPRSALMSIVEEARLPHVADPTNDDTTRARERIRHQVLPALEAIYPGAARHLASLARESAATRQSDSNESSTSTFDRLECRTVGVEVVAGRLRHRAEVLGGESIRSLPRAVWYTAASMIIDDDPRPRRLSLGPMLELLVHRESASIQPQPIVETWTRSS